MARHTTASRFRGRQALARFRTILSCGPRVRYHLYSLWLFTFSDLKTIVIPQAIFGLASAWSAEYLGLTAIPGSNILAHLPATFFWTWINLVPFAINNQRQPCAVEEDRINKSWRPMPSQRLSPELAKKLMLLLYIAAFATSALTGGLRQSAALYVLGTWYNDFGGADHNPITRNFINACGFLSFATGALEVAYGSALPLGSNSVLGRWLAVIGMIVFSSVQSQDMADQAGDAMRHRRTLPLTIGDWYSRVTIVVAVLLWSPLVPFMWRMTPSIYILQITLGAWVALRTCRKRGVRDDKKTFRLWNLWLVFVYLSPLIKSLERPVDSLV